MLFAVLGLAVRSEAHPILRQHHDRSLLVRVTESSVLVEYGLALDAWTLLADLVPFSGQIDAAGDKQRILEAYAQIYGPRVADGLLGEIGGRELRFHYMGKFDLKEEDHLRYVFLIEAPLPSLATSPPNPPLRLGEGGEVASVGRLKVIDSNFSFEPGVFRGAIRAEGRLALLQTNAPDDVEKAKPIKVLELDALQSEKARTLEADIGLGLPVAHVVRQPSSFDFSLRSEPSGIWEVLRSLDARRLLDSNLGLGVILALAFLLGAIHSLQPGHGKTLVAAYLVGEQGTIGHAFFLGLITTLTHTGMVILLALVVPLVWPGTESEITFGLALGSGILVILISVWLLLRRLAGEADHVHLFGGHHHHHGPDGGHHHLPVDGDGRVRWWALAGLGITGGLVPCGDAIFLLTTTWFILKQPWLGLPVVLVFSLGLASVLVALGVLTVKFKRFATSRWGRGRWLRALPVFSPVLTLLLGVWMCHEAVKHRPSASAPPSPVAQAVSQPVAQLVAQAISTGS